MCSSDLYFPTFLGRVIPVDLNGSEPVVGEEWSLLGDGDEGWRPGGIQVTGVDDAELDPFVAALPERYLATVPAESARRHFELWKRARGRAVTGAVHLRPDVPGASELVRHRDPPRLETQSVELSSKNSPDLLDSLEVQSATIDVGDSLEQLDGFLVVRLDKTIAGE